VSQSSKKLVRGFSDPHAQQRHKPPVAAIGSASGICSIILQRLHFFRNILINLRLDLLSDFLFIS